MLTDMERLEWAIDSQLAESHLWQMLDDLCEEDRSLALHIARGAFGAGYILGAQEPIRGGFANQHGYRIARAA